MALASAIAREFDEKTRKLNDMVLRAPGRRMAIARTDRKADARIERGRGVEIGHRMHDMIEAARHYSRVTSPKRTPSAAGTRF